MIRRRALLTGLALPAAALAVALPGCGFQLKGPPPLSFRTVTLTGFASTSPLATELARALEASGVDVVETSVQAAAAASGAGQGAPLARHVVLESLLDQREQVVASTSAYGQVRDLTLRTRFHFRLLRADGSVLLPPNELALERVLTFNEKDALAKQEESEALHRAMQTDIVEQVLRRLAVIRLDGPGAP